MDAAWFRSFGNSMIRGSPLLWLLCSIGFWLAVCALSVLVRRIRRKRSESLLRVRQELRTPVDRASLRAFLASQRGCSEAEIPTGNRTVTKAAWREDPKDERWGGAAPDVEIEFDEANGILLSVSACYSRSAARARAGPSPAHNSSPRNCCRRCASLECDSVTETRAAIR